MDLLIMIIAIGVVTLVAAAFIIGVLMVIGDDTENEIYNATTDAMIQTARAEALQLRRDVTRVNGK